MILVDMEMPKSCRFCHLQDVCVPFQREVVTEVVSIDTLNERHKDCPIEVEILDKEKRHVNACDMAIESLKMILDNVTNGDVIKALFPSSEVREIINDLVHYTLDGYVGNYATKEWWDAPYKSESEDKK